MSEFFQEFPVAIVGMACRLPGAKDLSSYWKLLKNGESAIGELPESRLNRKLYFDAEKGKLGKSYSLIGGLIPEVKINPAGMGLPENIGDTVDEAHLIICDVAFQAIRHAKMDPFNLKTRKVGVYVGGTGGSNWAGDAVFSRLIDETAGYLFELPEFKSGSLRHLGKKDLSGIVNQVISTVQGRYPNCMRDEAPTLSAHMAGAVINRALGLTGPYMAIDAACASSLKGLVLGVNAIQQGRLDMAIIGGASYCKSDSLVLFSQAHSVTANTSRPFDSKADGLVSSEGYVALVLKTLPRALADGDTVHAVIRGVGISTDGKGKSLWAPRKEGQILAIQRAYGERLDIHRLQYIEAHATSTKVGDSTELTALYTALKERLAPGQKITLGASKGNIGHTLETAGLAGLTKLVLSMQNQTIPPAVNVDELNKEFDWKSAPFIVPDKAVPWDAHQDGHQRRGAVNAFGIGGLNIHVVVDEFVKAKPKSVYISAATPGTELRQNEPIAIIGMGAIYPGAHTIEQFWNLLVTGKDPKTEVSPTRWKKELCNQLDAQGKRKTFKSLGGFVTDYVYDWKANKVPPKQIANANPLQFMLLDAAAQAIKKSGYDQKPFDRKRVGVVVGTIFGGDFSAQLQMGLRLPEFNQILAEILQERGVSAGQIEQVTDEFQEYLLSKMPALLDETGSFTSSTLASRITKTFDLMGGALALDAAECSGLAAVNSGVELLRSGACDMMLCAGVHRNMDYTVFHSMWKAGILADKPYPAFDERGDGVVPGEGVGVVVLKRLTDARRDGDPIQAIIRGIGYSSQPVKPGQAMAPAIRMAMDTANVKPAQIAAVETAVGIKNLEKDELKAYAETLGARDRKEPVVVGSVIGQLGTSGAATGMASLMKAALSLEHGELPPGIAVARPSQDAKQHASILKLPKVAEKLGHAGAGQAKLVSVTAMSSLGLAFDIILERGSPTSSESGSDHKSILAQSAAVASSQSSLVTVGAPDATTLLARLNRLVESDALPDEHPFAPGDRYRIAMVVRGLDELKSRVNLLLEHLGTSKDLSTFREPNVFCNDRLPQQVRMAWMYCGQGSQYSGMLRTLVSEFGPAAEAMKRADRALQKFGDLTFAKLAWDDSDRLTSDLLSTQLSILASQYIIGESLMSLGIRPQVVAGHSFGEYGALIAAGAWEIEEALACAYLRTESIERGASESGSMLALGATFEAAEQLISSLGGSLYIANHNSLKQVVLAGTTEQIAKAAKLARGKGYPSLVLPVTCAFHCPLMKKSAEIFAQGQNGISVRDARLPILSTASATFIRNAKELRKSLCDQLTMPVRYMEMTRRMVDGGSTMLVEIGPRQILTKLHRSMGLEVAGNFLAATDDSANPGLTSLLCVKAIAAVCGALDASLESSSPGATELVKPLSGGERARSNQPSNTPDSRKQQRLSSEKNRNGSSGHSKSHDSSTAKPTSAKFKDFLDGDHPDNSPAKDHEVSSGFGGSHYGAALGSTNGARDFEESNGHYDQHHASSAGTATLDSENSSPASPRRFSESELVEFLTEFVVEQTGYPPELVDLDANLEADLGIDSIKKAQMMGEVGERFQIAPPSGDVTLDSFPTLRHVVEFIIESQGTAADKALTNGHSDSSHVLENLNCTVDDESDSGSQALGDISAFLVDFVMEQTGYPAELIDLDANLEADLGIDSIKKAQMFGEIGETFNIAPPGGNVTLDDFPTLRKVIEFIHQSVGSSPEPHESVPLAESNGHGAPHVPAFSQNGHSHLPKVESEEAMGSADDLQKFLIDFVIEQTGYPEELIDLDANLEADLGIDSIKKAQMFGEIGEKFNIAPPGGNVTLDDFPTLRHVLAFINDSIGSSTETHVTATVPTPGENGAAHLPKFSANGHGHLAQPEVADVEESAADLQKFLVDFVIEQTGYPAELVDLDANLEADLGIDSIKKAQMFGEIGEAFDIAPPAGNMTLDDFPTLRHVLAFIDQSRSSGGKKPVASRPAHRDELDDTVTSFAPAEVSALNSTDNQQVQTVSREELQKFLIEFVIEQTGYPAELVDLDADLEADLGIDSIKKAQMFGEIGETFNVAPPGGNVTLDDFATLRRVLDFLESSLGSTPLATEVAEPAFVEESIEAAPSAPDSVAAKTAHHLMRIETSPVSSRVMRRSVFRLVPKPRIAQSGKPVWGQRALILGQNATSAMLAKRLRVLGVDVVQLDAGRTMESASRAVESAWTQGPCEHLFLTTSLDHVAASYDDPQAWDSRRNVGVMIPFAVSQKWFELVSGQQFSVTPTIVGAVALGGNMGQAGDCSSVEGAALAGMLKAIQGEGQAALRALVVDFANGYAAENLVRDLLAEVEAKPEEIEVSYDARQTRHVIRAAPQPASSLNQREVAGGGTWIATGGARGVVAYVATELGVRYGLKLHLVGSTEQPSIDPTWLDLSDQGRKELKAQIVKEARANKVLPADAWQKVERAIEIEQTLRNLRNQGVQVEYHSCDVSNRQRVADLVKAIRAKDGPITGVIHGAGVESACKFTKKKWETVSRTVGAKVDGCAALMAALADQPPQYFVGFASTSGRFGGVGQTDYSLANAMLVQLIANYRHEHPSCTAFAVDWTAWGEVGMAARPESKFALQAMNLKFMPPQEGADHLIDELQAEGNDAEILILDHPGAFSGHPLMSEYDSLELDSLDSPVLSSNEPAAAVAQPVDSDEAIGTTELDSGLAFSAEFASQIREALKLLADVGGVGAASSAFVIPDELQELSRIDSIADLERIATGSGISLISLLALRRKILDGATSQSTAHQLDAIDLPLIDDQPLLDSVLSYQPNQELVTSTIVSPTRDLFLVEHLFHKRPFLPAVVLMEIMAEAAGRLSPSQRIVRIRDVDLINGHNFLSDGDVELRTEVTLRHDVCSAKVSVWLDGMQKTDLTTSNLEFSDQAPLPQPIVFTDPVLGWTKFQYPEKIAPLYHGPSFRTFEELNFQHDGGKAKLRARPHLELAGTRPGTDWIIPSTLLDGCLVACAIYSYCMLEQRIELPRGFKQVCFYRTPKDGEQCKLRFYLRGFDAKLTHYDFTLIGEDGQRILDVEDFCLTRIAGGID